MDTVFQKLRYAVGKLIAHLLLLEFVQYDGQLFVQKISFGNTKIFLNFLEKGIFFKRKWLMLSECYFSEYSDCP